MDTLDRFDSHVPARLPGDLSQPPAPIPALPRELGVVPSPPAQFNPRVLLRGLNRHWWRILLLWLVLSAPLAWLIFEWVEPTYQAVYTLRVEPAPTQIYSSSEWRGDRGSQTYLQTQVEIIKSDSVLKVAINNPTVSNLPRIKKSEDPETELKNDLVVDIVGRGTYLIRVALESKIPSEAAAIVNAVVDAFMERHTAYHRSSNSELKKNLEDELKKLDQEIKKKTEEVKGYVDQGAQVPNAQPQAQIRVVRDGNAGLESSFVYNTASEHARATHELFDTEMKLWEADANLKAAEAAREQAQSAEGRQESRLAGEELEKVIAAEFYKDSEVAALMREISAMQEQIKMIRGIARRGGDPALGKLQKKLNTLEEQRDQLWAVKYDSIRAKLTADDPVEVAASWEVRVAQLRGTVERLKRKRDTLSERIRKMNVETKNQNNDTLSARLAEQDLTGLKHLQWTITEKLKQLDFEIGQDNYRVTSVDRAREPKIPSNNKRFKYMAAAPVGILFLMLGLFLVLEIKAERVADPESLSSRVQSEVYALPPLPTSRSIRRRNLPEADDQIEQFIQRLDHLRFAVCGTAAELETGRSVLITSAIGGEGKTTMGAQLAARCGNAGVSTLLIDADLRRTSLCSLLDIPEGPGLSDALEQDELQPSELVIPVQGGTFHLLPAGTPVQDVSRVLQSRKLGLLIGQFRQLYDLIIIDSPPVLPVPDALIIGRWVDGAVLAVRYDISRFPQVERARRQLDGAGITVLGTVINGMRHSDSYYGRYSYSRRRAPQAGASDGT